MGGKENYGFLPFGPIMLSLVSFTNGIYCLIKGSATFITIGLYNNDVIVAGTFSLLF
jgi:hypothetical protein